MRSKKPSRRDIRRFAKAQATGRKVLPLDLQRVKDAYPHDSKKILEMRARNEDLSVETYAWPGGYPMWYLTKVMGNPYNRSAGRR